MTKIELVNQALVAIRKASWTPQKWVYAIGNTPGYNFTNTWNYKAQQLLWQAAKMAGPSPPPSAFASPALQDAYIQMAAAYWEPLKWAMTVRDGYKGAPYQYPNSRNWKAQVLLWQARNTPPIPPPPPPDPTPHVDPDPLLQYVAVGAFSPWEALQWPRCRILISADPGPATAQWVNRATADRARAEDHHIAVWYVPDQVSFERALEVCGILGCDPSDIVADCETLYRWKLAYHSGVRKGIYNLSAIFEDDEARRAISSGEFHGMNEFYWNQDKSRRPDNHNLPVDSMQIACYNGCSDSTSPNCWEPDAADYKASGFWWPGMGAYQQGMTTEDWRLLPVRP